mgnify:CR=1 FL=1
MDRRSCMMKRPDLKIIYEDRWLIVADKPSGMLTMSTGKTDEIAAYPIARITGKPEIDLTAQVNPAWSAQFDLIKTVALEGKTVLTEADWAAVGAQFAAYTGWKAAKAGAAVEALGLDAVKKFIEQDKKAALHDHVATVAALAEDAA